MLKSGLKVWKRSIRTNSAGGEKRGGTTYMPVTYSISQLPSDICKKTLFTQLKEELQIPLKGIRQCTLLDKESRPVSPDFLADALYIDSSFAKSDILGKEFAFSGDSSVKFKVDFSQNTKEMIKMSLDELISAEGEDYKRIQQNLNEEIMLYRIRDQKTKAKGKAKGKNLFKLVNAEALQYNLSPTTPLRVYRNLWLRNGYDEPCYWTITSVTYKKKKHDRISNFYGELTWRGQRSNKIERVRSAAKKEWRYIRDPQTVALDPRYDPSFEPAKWEDAPARSRQRTFAFLATGSYEPSAPRDLKRQRAEFLEKRQRVLEDEKARVESRRRSLIGPFEGDQEERVVRLK